MKGRRLGHLELKVAGRHNILNALAAGAVALDMGVSFARVRAALKTYKPARRRFERIAEARGITVISDYAHHPTEVAALVEQARGMDKSRILAVFQPHRYSRTAALGRQFPPAFKGVDKVVLVPVYAASERPVPGGSTKDLHRHFRRYRKVNSDCAYSLLEAWHYIRKIWRRGDLLLIAGAGDVDRIATWARKELLAGK